ncbi:MAG: C25 family cysteine peptidase, partial [Candidatus Cloacimonetes bacterium]|nr:C25 family cysteine peptidase [Candidatus Cloacimonadota bacterium]
MKRIALAICLVLLFSALIAEQYTVSNSQNEVNLLTSDQNQIVLEMTLGHFNRDPELINGQHYYLINLKKEGLTLEAGLPQVPVISRSVIIPGTARMDLSILDSDFVEVVMPIAPSKGNLFRDVNPADVPYSFASFYNSDESYPKDISLKTEPFIIRDYRGMTVRFQPFVYYPRTQTLRIYTRIKVALNNTGTDLTNALTSSKNSHNTHFESIYQGMFLNFNQSKYPVLEEEGRILVITHSMFNDVIQPYVQWKRQKGFIVDVVDVQVAGPSANQIQSYIASQYNLNNDLVFVQIMGDAPQVPTLSSGGGGADPMFALIAGGDNYPDLFVGRFSAENVAQMQTQVQRTVYYERDIQAGSTWLQAAMGVASNEGGGSQGDMGESDSTHMDLIRTDLLNYGYTTVDQVYQALGGNATMITNNLNQGRGFINYVGHGSNTTWVTTGYSNNHVNALTNDNLLPFIVSVACVNGNFVSITCFAEAWLRATNNTTGEPTGAVANYSSSINQSWNSPMRAQDEITDLLVAESKQTIGGLYCNGSSKMIEVYGTDGANMYKTWHIFGDASLVVRTKDPQPLVADYTPILFLGMSNFSVTTTPGARVALSHDGVLKGIAIANSAGIADITLDDPPQEPMDWTITITAFNK